jgi:alpha-N-acetylgalactosaminidase
VELVNRRTDGKKYDVDVNLREMGLMNPGGYSVEDMYEDVKYGVLTPLTKIKVKVNPSGEYIFRHKYLRIFLWFV